MHMNAHYAVIGNPVLHSLSPLIHQRAFDFFSIKARYFAYEVQDFKAFAQYFHEGKGNFVPYSYLDKSHGLYAGDLKMAPYADRDFAFPVQGLSVTIPHKQAAAAFAQAVGYKVQLAGAANTLYWNSGILTAENTDIAGFYAPLRNYLEKNDSFFSAVIYGAGGAARAVLTALLHIRDLKTVYVCARRAEQAYELIAHFEGNAELLQKEGLNTKARLAYLPLVHEEFPCDLAVNTIPQWGENAESPRRNFTGVRYAYDLTYQKTPFLAQAEQAGCICQDGKAMFAEQAKAQFRLWTGLEIPEQCYADIFKK